MPKNRLRTRLFVVLILSLVIYFAVDLFEFEQWLSGGSIEARVERIQWVLALVFWPLFPIGVAIIYFGYRIALGAQFPPPDTKLIKTTKVMQGNSARLRGWVVIITGLSLCGLAVYGAVIVPNELAHLLTGARPFNLSANAPSLS